MVAAPTPPNEEERLRTLYSYEILDTMEEQSFDDVCRLAAGLCQTPIALISLLDRSRQWFKARVGLDIRETSRDHSFCAHAILEDERILVVPDARRDARFSDDPLVLTSPHVRFYAGVALEVPDGSRLGTICVIDHVAREFTAEQREHLRALARQVGVLLELRRAQSRMMRVLQQRERLARFVIHDLNNPLAALILNSEAILRDEHMSEDTRRELEQICDQLLYVNRLVKNFQDVAVSDVDALPVRRREVRVRDLVERVLHRVRPSALRLGIELTPVVDGELGRVSVDPDLLERILENLIHNALAFAPQGSAVGVELTRRGREQWRLAVRDQGRGVPEEDRAQIFEPHVSNGARRARNTTRGLGLAFCRMAVEAHGGQIWVEPNLPQGSTFVAEFPERPTPDA